jgi:hypothetical protein
LVELVLAVALGGMVCLGLGYVYAINTGLWIRSHAKMALHADGTRALEEISRAAAHASEVSLDGTGYLRLAFPPSPLGGTAPADTVFRLREGALYRGGRRLVPSEGDASIGVAEFHPTLVSLGGGPRTLRVQLALYARAGEAMTGDTMRFETAVHARNGFMGPAASPTGTPGAGGGEFF